MRRSLAGHTVVRPLPFQPSLFSLCLASYLLHGQSYPPAWKHSSPTVSFPHSDPRNNGHVSLTASAIGYCTTSLTGHSHTSSLGMWVPIFLTPGSPLILPPGQPINHILSTQVLPAPPPECLQDAAPGSFHSAQQPEPVCQPSYCDPTISGITYKLPGIVRRAQAPQCASSFIPAAPQDPSVPCPQLWLSWLPARKTHPITYLSFKACRVLFSCLLSGPATGAPYRRPPDPLQVLPALLVCVSV